MPPTPKHSLQGHRRTGVPFPRLLSVGRSAGYVGREKLVGHLELARRQTAAGRCRAVLLCGEPGIGKTRTAAEVAQAASTEGAIALYGRCDEEMGVPYQPFAEHWTGTRPTPLHRSWCVPG